jgi:alpha-galactosidase
MLVSALGRLGIVGRRIWLLATVAGLLLAMALPASSEAQLATTPTPYMGWNTYYGVGGYFDESTIKAVASSLISTGLRDAGYRIVWLDFGWATGARDAHGNLIVSATQWPDGMAGLTSWLHANGFQAGIYTDAGKSGCSGQGVGSYGHYQRDANQFAKWGFDAVKMDFCGAGQEWLDQPPHDPRTLYGQFSSALAKNSSRRPMILNVCNFWTPGQINGTAPSFADSSWDTYSWAPADAQSWRTDTDIGGTGSIQFVNVLRNLRHDTGTASNASQPGIQGAAGPPGSTPTGLSPVAWGHWNDPDYLGPGLGMTDAQAQSQFSMWAMVAAPLILGSDPRSLSSTSVTMLENQQVIAIDQDSLGAQGYLVSGQGTTAQVWVKPLANGDRAVALLNTSSSSQQITTSAGAIGMPLANQYTLLDVWANQSSTTSGTITATVPADTVVLYRVSAG